MTDQSTGWHPPQTAPLDGFEFEYLCDDDQVRRGSLGDHIRRDPRMIGWREIVTND